MQSLTRFLLLASLVACTEMEPTIADDESIPREISISSNTPPAFIAVREDADGQWLAPTVVDPTHFTFVAAGPYRVTLGCEGNDRAEVFQVARTLDDDPAIELRCTTSTTAQLTTTMVQPGTVTVGSYSFGSSDPNWDVAIGTTPGRHSVAAYDDTRMLIVRDVEVAAEGTAIPPLDLEAGFELVSGALTTDAMPDESVRSLVAVELGDTDVFVHDGDPAAARFVPDEHLTGGEYQYVEVSANRPGSSRFASSRRGGGRAMTLPAPMTSASLTMEGHDLTATWNAPLSGAVNLAVMAFAGNTLWVHQLLASESYASGEAATLELESITDLPATLLFDDTAPQTRFVGITADLGDGETVGVTASDAVN